MIKASLASEKKPQFVFNGIIKDKTNKNNLVYGNRVIQEVESGRY